MAMPLTNSTSLLRKLITGSKGLMNRQKLKQSPLFSITSFTYLVYLTPIPMLSMNLSRVKAAYFCNHYLRFCTRHPLKISHKNFIKKLKSKKVILSSLNQISISFKPKTTSKSFSLSLTSNFTLKSVHF